MKVIFKKTLTIVEDSPSLNRRLKFNRRLSRCRLTDGYLGVGNPTTSFQCLTKNQSVVHATGKCRKSDMMAEAVSLPVSRNQEAMLE